jgi:hypothetical protein
LRDYSDRIRDIGDRARRQKNFVGLLMTSGPDLPVPSRLALFARPAPPACGQAQQLCASSADRTLGGDKRPVVVNVRSHAKQTRDRTWQNRRE